jgi:hypothetical protein
MKPKVIAFLAIGIVIAIIATIAQDQSAQPRFEYATIRWAGKENTHLIRPGGRVEFIGAELRKLPKPDRTDDRAFYMNTAINGLSKEGFEVVTMTSDEVVLKRPIAQ